MTAKEVRGVCIRVGGFFAIECRCRIVEATLFEAQDTERLPHLGVTRTTSAHRDEARARLVPVRRIGERRTERIQALGVARAELVSSFERCAISASPTFIETASDAKRCERTLQMRRRELAVERNRRIERCEDASSPPRESCFWPREISRERPRSSSRKRERPRWRVASSNRLV